MHAFDSFFLMGGNYEGRRKTGSLLSTTLPALHLLGSPGCQDIPGKESRGDGAGRQEKRLAQVPASPGDGEAHRGDAVLPPEKQPPPPLGAPSLATGRQLLTMLAGQPSAEVPPVSLPRPDLLSRREEAFQVADESSLHRPGRQAPIQLAFLPAFMPTRAERCTPHSSQMEVTVVTPAPLL